MKYLWQLTYKSRKVYLACKQQLKIRYCFGPLENPHGRVTESRSKHLVGDGDKEGGEKKG